MNTRKMRNGGSVAHIMRDQRVSLCGRMPVMDPNPSNLRVCKTCARIGGVSATDHVDYEMPAIPEVTEWSAHEAGFIRESLDHFTQTEIVAFNIERYHEFPNEYTTPERKRFLAWMRACWRLANGQAMQERHDTPEATRKGGNGNGTGNGRARMTGATPNQRAALLRQASFIDSLFSQLFALQGKDVEDTSMVATLTDEYFNGLTREKIDKLFKANSSLIDRMKEEIAKLKRNTPKAEKQESAPAEDGYYIAPDGSFVCVKWNRARTGQYALVWDGASWEYDGKRSYGIVRDVKAGKLTRMTPDDAKRFGDLYGVCFKCSRTLTDPESIAQGYGPICAGRMGW